MLVFFYISIYHLNAVITVVFFLIKILLYIYLYAR